jgi:hypothetical protein
MRNQLARKWEVYPTVPYAIENIAGLARKEMGEMPHFLRHLGGDPVWNYRANKGRWSS